jgi:steroid delta-isomerase-like uncharacterized protein
MSGMSPEEVMRAWFEQVWTEGREDLIEKIMAPGVIGHRTHETGGDVVGPDGFRAFYEGIRAAFSDLRFEMQDVFASGKKVVGRWTMTGIHTGPFQGMKPTGKRVSITGMAVAYVEDGVVRESWDEWDRYGLLSQLGIVAPLGAASA